MAPHRVVESPSHGFVMLLAARNSTWSSRVALAVAAALAAQAASAASYVPENLAEGVTLFRPMDAASPRANSLVVERQDGLLVVDAQPTPQAARELLEEVAVRSSKPVRYLVLSHAHAEAAGGASAFPESTLVIAANGTSTALKDSSFDFAAEMRARADPASGWVDPPRRLPALVLFAQTDLDDPKRPVELMPLERGHSGGDLLVFISGEEILYAGGLVFPDGNPYAGDADLGRWLTTLNQICSDPPKKIVGVRGRALDSEALRRERDALAWLRGQVEQAFVDQLPLEGVEQRVLEQQGIEQYFDRAATPSFLSLLVHRATEEAVELRRKRGRWSPAGPTHP